MLTEAHKTHCSEADPGFSRGGTKPRGGAPIYYLAKFLPKTELKRLSLDRAPHPLLIHHCCYSPVSDVILPYQYISVLIIMFTQQQSKITDQEVTQYLII